MEEPKRLKITHLGGESCVTGSCHLVRFDGVRILVDCGSVQGLDREIPMSSWPVEPAKIDFLFLTHAHIDHIGRVPELIEQGFRGEILCTHPTKTLLLPMIEDALGFSQWPEKERERLKEKIDELAWGFEYDKVFDLPKGIRFRFSRAGHILGSCSICFEVPGSGYSVCFSGDLGPRHTPILTDPDPCPPCDLLVMESTYGDALHEDRTQRTAHLGEILGRALADGGKVLIPAFALGRTQEILYEIDRLISTPGGGKMPSARTKFSLSKIPVFLDSPLGLTVTKIYSELRPYWDQEARERLRQGDHPFDFEQLYAVRSHKDHLKILEMDGPAIIIAGSGMCSGGRILDHLRSGLEDPKTDILFVGYQAEGTLGRKIVEGANKPGQHVFVEGERCAVNARVHVLGGYSAHADQKGLLEWVASAPQKPGKIKLVHGEAAAREALARKLGGLGYVVEGAKLN